MTGRHLAHLRNHHKLSQTALAERLGVCRSLVSLWETGVRAVPTDRAAELEAAFGCAVVAPAAEPLLWLPRRPRLATPSPVKTTLAEMLDLGSIARQVFGAAKLQPAVALEVEHRLPRDTPYELLVAYRAFARGGALQFHSCDELGAELLVVANDRYVPESGLARHSIVLRRPGAALVLQPQVPVALVVQSRRYRLDFLATLLTAEGVVHADVEIDGRYHEETANEDARRAHGLALPTLRYPNTAVFRGDFIDMIWRDLAKQPSSVGRWAKNPSQGRLNLHA